MLEAHIISIKSSTLAYQPYQYFSESGSTFWLWKVEIDGTLFSETMYPARVFDSRIERFGCTGCGAFGDCDAFYTVRRLENRVLWIYEELLGSELIRSYENLPQYFLFECDYYEKVLGAGSTADLPEFKLAEIRRFLQWYVPPAALALYTSPEIQDDPHGGGLLASLKQGLEENLAIAQISGCPERLTEITIGLDLPGVAECKWLVGIYENSLCVMFVALPELPCWFYGDAINSVFKEYLVHSL